MTQKHSLTIQAVSIIGGILTAIFFLGFLALARILRSDISYLIVGSILILTTLTISRMVIRSFHILAIKRVYPPLSFSHSV